MIAVAVENEYGRYDNRGPQKSLYLPGQLLKARCNELIVLDLDPVGSKKSIRLESRGILEGDAEELL